MSWSINFIGTPENLVKALKAESQRLSGESKNEFDAAMPHMIGILEENFSENPAIMQVEANGHGHIEGGEKTYQNCAVRIGYLGGIVVN